MTDILKRLEDSANYKGTSPHAADLYRKAAGRIEELERENKFLKRVYKEYGDELAKLNNEYCHHVSKKMITEAWNLLTQWEDGPPRRAMLAIFQIFGIYRCEGCGGSGVCTIRWVTAENSEEPCPDCAPWGSKGWVVKNAD